MSLDTYYFTLLYDRKHMFILVIFLTKSCHSFSDFYVADITVSTLTLQSEYYSQSNAGLE